MRLQVGDMFGGMAGWAVAVEGIDALELVIAANHNDHAVAAYRANHPRVRVEQQDLQQADFRRWPRLDVLLGSPACQGHSRNSSRGGTGQRGTAPKHDADRSTAFAVLTCAEVHRPRVVVVENVPEMRKWVLYRTWMQGLRDLGYTTTEMVLDAADYGVPQERLRLFVIATLDGHKRRFEHEPPKQPRIPARAIVDLRRRDGWKLVRHAAAGVQARVARARAGRFPTGPFITNNVTNHPGRSLDRPLGTITTAPAHWGVVRPSPRGDEYRWLSIQELRAACDFAPTYWLPATQKHATRLLGNCVPPGLGRAVLRHALGAAA